MLLLSAAQQHSRPSQLLSSRVCIVYVHVNCIKQQTLDNLDIVRMVIVASVCSENVWWVPMTDIKTSG